VNSLPASFGTVGRTVRDRTTGQSAWREPFHPLWCRAEASRGQRLVRATTGIAIGGQMSGVRSHRRTVVTQRSARANSAPSRGVRMCGSVEAAPAHRRDGVPRSTVAGTTARVASTVLFRPATVSEQRVALQWLQLYFCSHRCRVSVPLAAVMVWCWVHKVGFVFVDIRATNSLIETLVQPVPSSNRGSALTSATGIALALPGDR
jgi:hypothetical protein